MQWNRAWVFLGVACIVGCGSSDSGASSGDADNGDDATGDVATLDGGGDAPRDGGDSTPEIGPPAVPTISNWLGTNLSADLPRVDVTYDLNAFDTAASSVGPDGMPVAGASGKSSTDIGFVLPTGDYNLQYKGDGKLDVSGIGALVGSWTTVGDEHRGKVHINGTPGAFGNFLTLTVTNGAGQTVHDVHLLMPGFDYDTPTVFTPQFIALLKPFRALRFMDWEATNGNAISDWAQHPSASVFGSSKFGQPWEHIVELINETGKDAWLTVQEHASDDYVTQLARFLAKNLDFSRIQSARIAQGYSTPFQLILENSNETWNNGFTAYKTFLDAANADPSRYSGKYTGTYGPSWMCGNSDLMKVGQYEGDRLVKIAKTFRTELGAVGKADVVAPVLSGWALGACYSDVALRFVKDNYGDPKTMISYVALAPYFGPDDKHTSTLDDIFANSVTNIDSMTTAFGDFAKLGKEWGIAIAAYEGGQSLSGTADQTTKHLAQHDERMYETYLHYFDVWKKAFGESLFMHFSLAGDPGLPENIYQYGYWGSIIGVMEDPAKCAPSLPKLTGTESIASVVHHCPKYRALMEQVPH